WPIAAPSKLGTWASAEGCPHSLVSRLLETDFEAAARAASCPLRLRLLLGPTLCCLDLLSPSPHSTLHERPWRAAWLPQWERPLPPQYLFPGVFNLQALQSLPIFSHSSPRHPSRATLACRLVASTFIFGAEHTFPKLEVLGSLLWASPSAVALLTTLGCPTPTAVAESQWGEPRSRAFGTGARVAGSISSGPVLLPLVGNLNPDLAPGVGWRRGRRGRAGVAGLSFIGSWLWSDAPYARFVVIVELPDSPRFRAGGPYNVAPYLFLHRRPLTTLGRLPPTAVAESQWGEPCSDASGTSAWSILTWHHYGCQVGEEEGGVGQEWQAYSLSSPGRGAMVSVGVDSLPIWVCGELGPYEVASSNGNELLRVLEDTRFDGEHSPEYMKTVTYLGRERAPQDVARWRQGAKGDG
ncbi:hypothetical protein EDB84DRAFT_1446144, partial [Lactarius hengduanensis]